VCPGEVFIIFITFGGPQGHADRLANPRRIVKSARWSYRHPEIAEEPFLR
jgi:hypothetical protein